MNCSTFQVYKENRPCKGTDCYSQKELLFVFEAFYWLPDKRGQSGRIFSHENQSFPPSLSQNGTLRPGNKSDLFKCLEKVHPSSSEVPATDAVVLDGSAIVNMVQTFQDYEENCFIPYLQTEVRNAKKLDIVWDIYLPNSLKSVTREKWGAGKRRRVEGSMQIPVK